MDNCGLQPYHKPAIRTIFRRPAPAHLHCPRPGPEPGVCCVRRTGLCTGRFHSGQIINLLKELQDKYNLTYLFISHDLSVVEHISDTVGVMYLGNLVEYGATPDIFSHPLHPYTKHCSAPFLSRTDHSPRAHCAAGLHSVPGQPAQGLQVPYPLPLCDRALQDRSAAAA